MSSRFWLVPLLLSAACASPTIEDQSRASSGVATATAPAPQEVRVVLPRASSAPLAAASASVSAPPADPALDWLRKIDPENVDADATFDGTSGVRYAADIAQLGEGSGDGREAKLLCDPKEVAQRVRDIMDQREMVNGELARCTTGPTKVHCMVFGWHDAPDYGILLRRPTSTTYRIEAITAVSRAAIIPDAVEKAEAWTSREDTKLRAKRCPRK